MAARMTKKSVIVAGVMSGTSADGINVALVRFAEPGGAGFRAGSGEAAGSRGRVARLHTSRAHAKFELLGHAEYSYPKKVRAAVLAAMNAPQARVAELARLNFLLGELYADAVLATERRFQIKAALIGCHGQTLYHQGEAAPYLGRRLAATWQTGESAIVAARLGVPVVSDFRPADMAVGGKGAPLVPFLDYLLFRDARLGRIVQNIGGIANLTAIPAGAVPGDVVAFHLRRRDGWRRFALQPGVDISHGAVLPVVNLCVGEIARQLGKRRMLAVLVRQRVEELAFVLLTTEGRLIDHAQAPMDAP